jgi:ATP-binding cassette subfamily B protein
LWLVLLVVQGLLPAATVSLTRQLVDSLVVVIDSSGSWEAVRTALVWTALMAGVLLTGQLLGSLSGWVRTAQAELVSDHVTSLVHRKSVELDLSFYDSADYYDHLHRARAEASSRPISLLENLGTLLQNTITLVAMAAVLARYAWWLPFALFASTLPALYVVLRFSLREHAWRMARTADERYARYNSWLLSAREVAAELRLFGLGDHFQSRYRQVRCTLREQRLALLRSRTVARLGAGFAGILVTGAVMVWMIWQAVQGLYSLGDLAAFYQAFNYGQGLMRSLLENLGQIYSSSLYLENLFEFLALSPLVVDPEYPAPAPAPLDDGIRFEKVTFRYPGSERAVLQDLCLHLPAGQTVAIVGTNGAGKSTLVKLLCRFYDPEAGWIKVDGTDLRDMKVGDLRSLITVLFQEPVHYHASASENIAMGNLDGAPDATEIEAAAQASGADEPISRLPLGFQNMLGKYFEGGTDLSVGEWQRVALARALLRQAPIIVLDEPTSAMDSWTEIDWLRRFRLLASGRTALLITHRFT